jgi:hypothetical protein
MVKKIFLSYHCVLRPASCVLRPASCVLRPVSKVMFFPDIIKDSAVFLSTILLTAGIILEEIMNYEL